MILSFNGIKVRGSGTSVREISEKHNVDHMLIRDEIRLGRIVERKTARHHSDIYPTVMQNLLKDPFYYSKDIERPECIQ